MVGIAHWDDPRTLAAENAVQRFVNLREFLLQLVELVFVVLREGGSRSGKRRGYFDAA